MGTLDPSSTKQAPQSRSRLLEASRSLRQYLFLASKNNISEAVSLAKPNDAQSFTADVNTTLAKNAEAYKDLREIALQTTPTSGEELDSAKDNSAPPPAGQRQLPDSQSENVLTQIQVTDFPPTIQNILGLQPNQALTQTAGKATTIRHLMVKNSGRGINFSDRNTEYVAIFSNLIPTVEFSKCVPYFNIRFIQNIPTDGQVPMPFLVLDSFVGAIRKNSNINGQGSSTPNAAQVEPVDRPSSKLGQTVSGMELFQAPQTLIRPGINHTSSYKALRGVPVLDPMQPLASIDSINIDVMGLSENFMTTQTKIDLSLVLHDRSRLMELSPLVSPSIYPTIRAEITWGWSHPDTSSFSKNPYAKFLNALRSTQVFCVSSSSFSNRDSSSIGIKLQLTGLGEYSTLSTSILTGKYVSYELVRARMNQLFTIIDTVQKNTKDPKATPQRSQTFVGAYEQPIALSNWESSDKWVEYEDYAAITNLISSTTGGQEAISALVAKYAKIVSNLGTNDTNGSPSRSADLLKELKRDINSVGTGILSSPYVVKYQQPDPKTSETNEAYKNFFERLNTLIQNDAATLPGYVTQEGVINSAATTTLGDLIYRLYTLPMSLTGIYDEIRITTFDFNDHAGMLGSINIGAFPFETGLVNEALRSNMSVEKALQSLIRLAGDPSQPAYGIKAALIQKQEAETAFAESIKNETDEETQSQAIELATNRIQEAFEKQLSSMYSQKSDLLSNGVSYEPKFTAPRLRLHTEVVPVLDGDIVKQVLNVFIYDESNTGSRSTNLLSSIYQSDKGAVRITSQGSDIISNVCDAKKNADQKTYTVTADRAQVKRIIMAATPTLKIGTEGTAIISANYSTQASGDLANLNLLRSYKNSGGASRADSAPGITADLFVIPASLKLTMLGMPLVNRGQTFFVDFGTGTTLDNTYTVMSVNHSIKGGQFTTNITLNITNQGTIKAVTSMIQTDLAILQQYVATTTPPAAAEFPKIQTHKGNWLMDQATNFAKTGM